MIVHFFYLVGIYLIIMELVDFLDAKNIIRKTEEAEAWDEKNPDAEYEDKPKSYRDFVESRVIYTWTFLIWAIVGMFTKHYVDFIIFFCLTLLVYPKVSSNLRGYPIRKYYNMVNSLFVIGFIIYEITKHYNS